MKTRLTVAVLLATALTAGTAVAQTPHSNLSRADIQADLRAWKLSGMDTFHRGEAPADFQSAAYRAAQQRYLQLTQGEHYQAPAAGKSRQDVKADLNDWKRAGLHQFSRGESEAFPPQRQAAYQQYVQAKMGNAYQQPVMADRETVRQDLQRWKAAGLDAFWRGESTPELNSAEYRAAMQRYKQM